MSEPFKRRLCAVCGKEFKPRSFKCRTCSPECREKKTKQTWMDRKPHPVKVCPTCGKEFKAKSAKQNTCSYKCSAEYRKGKKRNMVRVDKVCIVCDEEFSVPNCFKDQLTCSLKCSRVYRMKRVSRNCRCCGKEIVTRPSNDKVFCSRACMRKHVRGANHPLWTPVEIKICMHCLKDFPAKGWKKENVFCSGACMRAWRIEHVGPRSAPIGTVTSDAEGYKVVKIGKRNWRPEHRIVAENTIGRPLKKEERVHHINGNPADNRPENLRVCANNSEHMRIHYEAERIGLSVMAAENWLPTAEGIGC